LLVVTVPEPVVWLKNQFPLMFLTVEVR